MEAALIKIGLPVKCCWANCKTHGFVKPATDHGGWMRRSGRRWYCPKHAKEAQEFYKNIEDSYKTPKAVPVAKTTEQELYDLI